MPRLPTPDVTQSNSFAPCEASVFKPPLSAHIQHNNQFPPCPQHTSNSICCSIRRCLGTTGASGAMSSHQRLISHKTSPIRNAGPWGPHLVPLCNAMSQLSLPHSPPLPLPHAHICMHAHTSPRRLPYTCLHTVGNAPHTQTHLHTVSSATPFSHACTHDPRLPPSFTPATVGHAAAIGTRRCS